MEFPGSSLLNSAVNLAKAGASYIEAKIDETTRRINMSELKESNAIVLTKGVNISLDKEIKENGMKKVCIGLAWDKIVGAGAFDADAIVAMLDANGKIVSNGAVYYKLATSSGAPFKSIDGSIHHSGDNLTGEGDGDDEIITIELDAVPANVAKLDVIINIHEAAARRQNFGQVPSCKARAYNKDSNEVLAKYDLVEDFSGATAVLAVQLYRYEDTWKFKALGNALTGNLQEIIAKYE